MKRYLPFIIVAAVALLTVGAAAMLYNSKRKSSSALAASSPAQTEESSKSATAHVRGAADAPVTLEEFGDFQCPPCGQMAGPLRQIEKEYGKKLRVIFYNFPFDIHQHARAAAYAAEAAGLQGHFWEMHDLLYREQAAWSNAPDAERLFESYATMLGLDIGRFRQDVQSEAVKQRVTADQQLGASRGVKNTPTIFVNKHQLPPTSLGGSGVRQAIDHALAQIPQR
ncbi:MAG: thioredoxin domain-containing protein [Verrucomicrobia bacterium]|nr:thioredoxin domain-containing protein [Verrucomicrobiota bacterium]